MDSLYNISVESSKPQPLNIAATPSIEIPIQFSNSSYSNDFIDVNHNSSNNYSTSNRHITTFSTQSLPINTNGPVSYSNNHVNIVHNHMNLASATQYDLSITNSSLSPPSNFDTNLYNHHFGSPFQNFYKLPSELINNQNSLTRNNQFKEKSFQGALAKKRISAFIPVEEVIENEKAASDNETVQKIFNENFIHDGHIDDMVRVLSFHPKFLKEFVKFHNYLMYSQGALPYDLRHYIAIMGASRHKCLYLVHQQEAEFISQKGHKNWLLGLDQIPQKLKDLSELNKIICHQPWLINGGHIEKLLKNQYNNNWSITELVMAVTILTHFHAMSGFVFGCGISESYNQELAAKKEKEVEEKMRLEKDRLEMAAQTVLKNKKQHNVQRMAVKYNHMHSNETDSEDGDEEDDEFDEDFNENADLSDEEFDQNELYFYNRRRNKMNYDQHSCSNSTGTVNRTLSNSSASSCEIGIDSLLKEMQVIQADVSQKQNGECSNNIPITKLIDSDLPIMPTQMFLKNTSGSNTLTNSPISSAVSAGQINYLTDLSNCSKTVIGGPNRASWVSHQNFNDLHDENTDEQNIDIDEGSDLDDHTYDTECQDDYDDQKSGNKKHFKKYHHSNRPASVNSSRQGAAIKNGKNQQQITVNNDNTKTASTNYVESFDSSSGSFKNNYVLKYVYDPDFGRLNFKKADQSLKLEYYTWENQGYRTASSFYSEICEFLDKNFRIAGHMTYNTMGSHKEVDTSLFRRAVWLYIHSLFGINYDDYDYNQIKQLICSPLRKYIKIICSCPDRVTKKDYDSIMKEFTHSEKIHINIVIMEARIQASILYFLRAINSYFLDNAL